LLPLQTNYLISCWCWWLCRRVVESCWAARRSVQRGKRAESNEHQDLKRYHELSGECWCCYHQGNTIACLLVADLTAAGSMIGCWHHTLSHLSVCLSLMLCTMTKQWLKDAFYSKRVW